MPKYLYLVLLVSLSLLACGKTDLALINAVKTFESHLQDIHETYHFIDRNLTQANQKYPAELKELASFVSTNAADTLKATGFDLQFKRLMLDKDKIEIEYKQQKRQFEAQLVKFNNWQKKLMKNKLGNDEAKQDFAQFEKQFADMESKANELKQRLQNNFQRHNEITRDKAFSVGNYNNFHWEAH